MDMSQLQNRAAEISPARVDAILVRQNEIRRVMDQVDKKRLDLQARFEADFFDDAEARKRNKAVPGILGALWAQFIELSKEQKIHHLGQTTFNGMHWQSLLQCSPYVVWRDS